MSYDGTILAPTNYSWVSHKFNTINVMEASEKEIENAKRRPLTQIEKLWDRGALTWERYTELLQLYVLYYEGVEKTEKTKP